MTRVWLSNDVEGLLAELPDGVEADVWDGRTPWPDSVRDVEFFVLPYMVGIAGWEPVPLMPRLKVVQALTAGYDGYLPLLPERVTLCNAHGVHDSSTAELAVTLTLACLRGLPEFIAAAAAHEWRAATRPSLADRTVLILGYGSIGAAVERRLEPFEVDVIRVARTAREGPQGYVHGVDDLPVLLGQADVVVVTTPLTDATRGLVDAAFLARMHDGALLVNVSRGAVVDDAALIAELSAGRLTAALDVTDPEPLPPDHPLWSAPGLVITPHVGGDSTAFPPRATSMVAEQLRRFVVGEPLVNVVAGPGSTLRE
jgi:phosphoglycerate dehydrogenase-like enzyme